MESIQKAWLALSSRSRPEKLVDRPGIEMTEARHTSENGPPTLSSFSEGSTEPDPKRPKSEQLAPTSQSAALKQETLPEPPRWKQNEPGWQLSDEEVPPTAFISPALAQKIVRKRKLAQVEDVYEASWGKYIRQLGESDEERNHGGQDPVTPLQEQVSIASQIGKRQRTVAPISSPDVGYPCLPQCPDLGYTTATPSPVYHPFGYQPHTTQGPQPVIWPKPFPSRDVASFDDGAWKFSIAISQKYNIRYAVKLFPGQPDYYIPEEGALLLGHTVTICLKLQENYEWHPVPNAGDANTDMKLSVTRTPNYQIAHITTLVKGARHLAYNDEDGFKSLVVTLSTGNNENLSFANDTPYVFFVNVETNVVPHEPSYYSATCMMFSREMLWTTDEALQRLKQIEALQDDRDDAGEKTVVADLVKVGQKHVEDEIRGVWWFRLAATAWR